MDEKIYIPKTIKVGYQERSDTYTQTLAYIIYTDDKGKLRKETSWESWRDKKIRASDFNNEPTEGFVLNKKVGGDRYSWNPRQTYTRVYDPRGFEFEITIPNLLYILENTSSIKGKGLENKFVYGWQGKDLILIPVDAPEYQAMQGFSQLQAGKVSAKSLVEGEKYQLKNQDVLTYLGKRDVWETKYTRTGDSYYTRKKTKAFVFANDAGDIQFMSSVSSLAKSLEQSNEEYPNLVEKFLKSTNAATTLSVEEKPFVLRELNKEKKKDNNSYGYGTRLNFLVKGKENEYLTYQAIVGEKSEWQGSTYLKWENHFTIYRTGKYIIKPDGEYDQYSEWTQVSLGTNLPVRYNWESKYNEFTKEDVDKTFPDKLKVTLVLTNGSKINLNKQD